MARRLSPPEPAPELARGPASRPEDAPLVALCEALVRANALKAKIAYELIASRSDLQAIVAARRGGEAEPPVRTLSGWRRELVGAELTDLLEGRLVLAVHDAEVRESRVG